MGNPYMLYAEAEASVQEIAMREFYRHLIERKKRIPLCMLQIGRARTEQERAQCRISVAAHVSDIDQYFEWVTRSREVLDTHMQALDLCGIETDAAYIMSIALEKLDQSTFDMLKNWNRARDTYVLLNKLGAYNKLLTC